ncbi:putative bifunctional diguanylate cyclase/phosphodiesterase [Spiribacter halobius]|uniref:EAL domain-containing protein n=1 Tax=Sediminicurvatus halobius TaxID=2182432 RepID=A0A2U2MX08_9GAMM|nr:GGDEF domain-containing phosphodiesterase [Spiribacter halobius]PWG61336.1 hypothetical protein DEM34_16880 [Spiribacter halobius]UEX76755.1 EAL domain-containing protein [Spiribacter halobius]
MDIPSVLERAFDAGAPVGGGKRLAVAIGVPVLFGLVAILVYVTGGTQNAYLHLIYLPILAAAAAFGMPGGLVAGLIAGLVVLGPAMPIDTATGAPQPLSNWLFRAGMLLLFGMVAGLTVGRLREQLDRVRGTAYRHPFSGLPTRAALEAILAEILARQQGSQRYAVLTIQVNNNDQIFNILGSAFIDGLPGAIAERLRLLFPRRWQIFQSDSGKLLALVGEATATVMERAEQVVSRLNEPVTVTGVPVYIDVSVGVASVGYTDDVPDAVLQKSNFAAGHAHRLGLTVKAYSRSDRGENRHRIDLLAEVPRALEAEEFKLLYQPQYSLDSGRLAGAEALLRWRHPVKGMIPPGDFVPLVEDTALISRVSDWVVNAAIAQAVAWRAAGFAIPVAINLAPRNLHSPKFVARVIEALGHAGLDPRSLEVEITETAIIQDSRAMHRRLSQLKEAGATIALDDFGDGYTSVRHLTSLPIDRLKIDRSLVSRVRAERAQARIVSAILLMARDLGLQTVAEGVEDEATETFLREHDCQFAQGFFYSRPVAPEEVPGLQVGCRGGRTQSDK